MCGITGLFEYRSRQKVCENLLRDMTRALAHRGPDAEGIHLSGNIGLGHRRLSILDLSEHAAQPMSIVDGRLVITYNGEIYNYQELRAELEGKGRAFRSTSDTEVIAHVYDEWGEAGLDRLSGIFAFAIWDEREQRLFLARDPLGVKPLFYSLDDQTFRFASEIRPLLLDKRVSREFCDEGLDAYFSFGYSAAPLTGLKAVKQLLPGHCATIDRDGLRITKYWSIPYEDRPTDIPFDELVEQYDALFQRVVDRQLVSDVPVGAFLSGGLDSTAIVSAIHRGGRRDIKAFSIGFKESSFNELPFAQEAAREVGVDLLERTLDLDAVDLLQEISRFLEEPTADSSAIPVYLLCKMTAEHVKVALSGDGADEILAGYDTYRANRFAHYYRLVPPTLRQKLIAPVARRIPISDRKYNLHQMLNRFVNGAEEGPGRDHCSWRIMLGSHLKECLYTGAFRERTDHLDPIGRYADALDGPPEGFESLSSFLHADTTFYLPNDMLVKVDRMSMAHGLEVRVPFLDKDLVAFCANLPADAKLHRGKVRKHILRESMRGRFSNGLLDRPKSGFNVPIEAWMRQPRMKELLMDLVRQNDTCVGKYLQTEAIERILAEHIARRADHGHALFTILMFALWCQNITSHS